MKKTLMIEGMVVVSLNENSQMVNLQFCPDDELAFVLERSCITHGQLQILRNGMLDFIADKPRVRANSLLIRKVAHGRLSGTRDHAIQLTLKAFSAEGIDWQKVFVVETVEALTDLMGPERMSQILNEMLNKLSVKAL